MHNNQQIAANFSAYACEYQQQASLQRQIAQDLLKFINAKGVRISADDHLLDIGAGTGFIKQAIDEIIRRDWNDKFFGESRHFGAREEGRHGSQYP